MGLSKTKASVSLKPSTAEDSDILELSTEEVVAKFLTQEKRRAKDAKDNDNEQEVVISFRSLPDGLATVVTLLAIDLGISRGLLTRCLSHRIVRWFDTILEAKQLSAHFYEIYRQAADAGFMDLCAEAEAPSAYQFNNTKDRGNTFRSIMWVKGKLEVMSLPLGVPTNVLFSVGLCESLLTGSVGQGIIRNRLLPEVELFRGYLKLRLDKVNFWYSQVNKRLIE